MVIRKDVKETLLLRLACDVTTAVWNGDDITVVIWFSVAVKVSVDIGETPVVWASDDVVVVPGFDGQITAEVWTMGIVGSDDDIEALSTVIQPKSFQVLCKKNIIKRYLWKKLNLYDISFLHLKLIES